MNEIYILYFDLDGVIVDLENGFIEKSQGIGIKQYIEKYGIASTREIYLREPKLFWINLNWIYGGRETWEAANKMYRNIKILSSAGTTNPIRGKPVIDGKTEWVKKNLPSVNEDDIIIVPGKHLKQSYANPNSILIDDKSSTIHAWSIAGGIGIHHRAKYYKKTIEILEDIASSTKLGEIAKRMGY
jgi:5'(3')-deoxyribonucleotidase